MLAVKHDDCEVAIRFIHHGAFISKRDDRGRNVIHHLLKKKSPLDMRAIRFLEELIGRSPELIYERDKSGHTPLHYLAMNNHRNALNPLLQGLWKDETSRNHRYLHKKAGEDTAYDIARDRGHHGLAAAIIHYDPKLLGRSGKDKHKHLACRRRRREAKRAQPKASV